MAATTLNVFGVNRIFNKVLCAFRISKHGSGHSSVHYFFFQSTDVVVITNLFLFGFEFLGPINVVVSTVPEQNKLLKYYYYVGSMESGDDKKLILCQKKKKNYRCVSGNDGLQTIFNGLDVSCPVLKFLK